MGLFNLRCFEKKSREVALRDHFESPGRGPKRAGFALTVVGERPLKELGTQGPKHGRSMQKRPTQTLTVYTVPVITIANYVHTCHK